MTPRPAMGADPSDDIVFQSSELKIYRALSHGNPVLVLTNLDAEGNLLSGEDRSCAPGQAPRAGAVPGSPAAAERGRSAAEGGASSAAPTASSEEGSVRVVVNGESGTTPGDQQGVVVKKDDSGGTTVIININPPAPEQKEAPAVPAYWSSPILTYGGFTGAIRYPDHQYFLGYGPGISSPSMFGGLGLNAGNHFGLKSGASRESGFDSMFLSDSGR